MVEPASATAGVGIRRGYALRGVVTCRRRPRERADRVTGIAVTIVVMDALP
jgi:hypothetical protein